MGTLAGTSEANLVVTSRESFEKELGIPIIDDLTLLVDTGRIAVGPNDNIWYTTKDGEVREIQASSFDILDGNGDTLNDITDGNGN
ncbi:hypothetical protein [Sphingobacterium mizutaii]|uniref:hypothetical protein n=1 Tax=Sphingobacterium mizutaii TaxID=1010 RepID=UPI00289E23DB|nr:hypothetical protein [Sphingobacterium mizutaii]